MEDLVVSEDGYLAHTFTSGTKISTDRKNLKQFNLLL